MEGMGLNSKVVKIAEVAGVADNASSGGSGDGPLRVSKVAIEAIETTVGDTGWTKIIRVFLGRQTIACSDKERELF